MRVKQSRNFNIKVYKNSEVTKEILDDIKVGDRISQTTKYMKVVGVSENFIFAVQNNFGELWHSVFSKTPDYNGRYFCGPMNGMGGCAWEDVDTPEGVQKNLDLLESRVAEISRRRTFYYTFLTIAKKKEQ